VENIPPREQLYSSKRDAHTNKKSLKKLKKLFVMANTFSSKRNFWLGCNPSSSIKEAIERKLKQEQESLEYDLDW